MITEIVVVLSTLSYKWINEAPELLKYAAEILGALTAISLFFKKVRVKLYSIYYYFYAKLPLVRLQKQDRVMMGQIASDVGEIKAQVNIIDRRTLFTQSLQWLTIDESYDGKIIADEKGNWQRINRTFLIWFAAKEEEMTGEGWVGFLSEDTKRVACESYAEIIKHQSRGTFNCNMRRNGIINYDLQFSIKTLRSVGTFFGFEITVKKL
jgi:PAS domain-containing protein